MQRFTLIHDGSTQGWRTAYLAFHVAARFGAPLHVYLVDSDFNIDTPAQRAAQVEIGGRAAGLAIETHIVADTALDTILTHAAAANGLFLPRRLLAAGSIIEPYLDTLPCPVWIVSEESDARKMAVLLDDPAEDKGMLAYAVTLAQRVGETLTCLMPGEIPLPAVRSRPDLNWISLRELSAAAVTSALDRLQSDLLILRLTHYTLAAGLDCACVIYQQELMNV